MKQGAENLMQTLGNGPTAPNKEKARLFQEAENMLKESKNRMEYIRMQILRVQAALDTERGNNGSRKNLALTVFSR